MGKTSSKDIISLASEILKDPKSSGTAKKLAGSVLSQAREGAVSSDELSSLASMVLNSDKYSETTKSLAGSVLSQAEKSK